MYVVILQFKLELETNCKLTKKIVKRQKIIIFFILYTG